MLSPISKLLNTHSLNIAKAVKKPVRKRTVSKILQYINVAKHCIVLLFIVFKKYETNKSNDADLLPYFHQKLKTKVLQISISILYKFHFVLQLFFGLLFIDTGN